tara:strand:- start:234 stop:392 length:159 start_codon:yes stop_codon:yes gene_type:complete
MEEEIIIPASGYSTVQLSLPEVPCRSRSNKINFSSHGKITGLVLGLVLGFGP